MCGVVFNFVASVAYLYGYIFFFLYVIVRYPHLEHLKSLFTGLGGRGGLCKRDFDYF